MDFKSQHEKQVEYHNYVENQRENYTDLTSEENDSVRHFAEILFKKREKNLGDDIAALLMEEGMEPVDLFCMLVELVLYGLDILSEEHTTIFDIKDMFDDMIDKIRSYLKKNIGIDMDLNEEWPDENINLYRDRDDYYCHITRKPPPFLCYPGWYILNYRLLDNKKFVFDQSTPLEQFKAFFISRGQIFTICFKFIQNKL